MLVFGQHNGARMGQGGGQAIEEGGQVSRGVGAGPQDLQGVKDQRREATALHQGFGHGQCFPQVIGRTDQQAREVHHLRTQDLSRYTVNGYRRNVEWFFAWLKEQTGRDMPLAEVTTFDVQRYRDHLIDAGHKPSTINRRLAALRAFFAWAAEQDHTAINPAAGIKSIQHKRRAPKGLSKQQVYLLQRQAAARRQLAEALAGQQTVTPAVVLARRDEAILAVLIYTGLRVGELVNLRLRDVEINARSGKVCVYGKGRGKKYRDVPLHVEARKALEA